MGEDLFQVDNDVIAWAGNNDASKVRRYVSIDHYNAVNEIPVIVPWDKMCL